MPNFERAVQHICIHTGGRAVLEGLQKQLQLSDAAMAPSKAALWRYGNTSSASIWCAEEQHRCKCMLRSGLSKLPEHLLSRLVHASRAACLPGCLHWWHPYGAEQEQDLHAT